MDDIKLFTSVSEAVRNIFGESRHVVKRNYVAGGDINEACALTLDDGTILFMKSNALISLENFLAEAAGLEAIRATGAIGVPDVLGAGTDTGFSFLLLEYIRGGSRISHYWETFAEELAAMTELFGGFPQAFYDAYRDTGMLQPGYRDRRDLYNLYQLLNHLNMFGRGYLPDVRRILKKYAG